MKSLILIAAPLLALPAAQSSIVWSFETDDDIDDYVKGVPAGIKNPR